jgi:hypothetical protein
MQFFSDYRNNDFALFVAGFHGYVLECMAELFSSSDFIPTVAHRILHSFPRAVRIPAGIFPAKIRLHFSERPALVSRIGSHVVAIPVAGRVGFMLLATRSVVSVEVATEIRVVVGTGTPSGSVSSLLRDLFHVNLGMTYGILDCFRPLSGLFPTRTSSTTRALFETTGSSANSSTSTTCSLPALKIRIGGSAIYPLPVHPNAIILEIDPFFHWLLHYTRVDANAASKYPPLSHLKIFFNNGNGSRLSRARAGRGGTGSSCSSSIGGRVRLSIAGLLVNIDWRMPVEYVRYTVKLIFSSINPQQYVSVSERFFIACSVGIVLVTKDRFEPFDNTAMVLRFTRT